MSIKRGGGLVWRAIRYRPVLAGVIFGVSQLVAGGLWFVLPHQYKAEAVVLLDVNPNPAQVVSNDEKANALAAKLNLLSSRLLADRVIARLGLASSSVMRESWESMGPKRLPFDEWLANMALWGVVPSASPGSYLVKIGYVSPSDEYSTAMANAFAEELVVLSDQLNRGFDRFADRSFDLAQKRSREELIAAQAALRKSTQNEVILDGVSDPALRTFLRGTTMTGRSVRAYLEGDATSQTVGGMGDTGSLLDDTYLISQREKLVELKGQRAQAISTMGEGHPVVKALDSSIRSTEKGLLIYESKRRASLAVGVRAKAQVAEQLSKENAEAKSELLAREQLRQTYESRLQEVENIGTRYEDDLTRYELMQFNRDVPRSDVRLMTRATRPDDFWFPHWTYYVPASLVTGLLYAMLGAYLMERRDRRVRSAEDVLRVVGVDFVDTLAR